MVEGNVTNRGRDRGEGRGGRSLVNGKHSLRVETDGNVKRRTRSGMKREMKIGRGRERQRERQTDKRKIIE